MTVRSSSETGASGGPQREATGATRYAYRPSPLAAPWEFEILPDALEWRNGPRSGRIRYDDIRRVRLAFRPQTLQAHRFVAEIWGAKNQRLTIASSSWSGVMQQERHDAEYAAFIAELHRRLAAARAPASFETGNAAFIYWPGLVVFIAISLGLAAFAVRALLAGSWDGAAVTVALAALFLWQTGGIFRRNRPGRYRPDVLPRQVVPQT